MGGVAAGLGGVCSRELSPPSYMARNWSDLLGVVGGWGVEGKQSRNEDNEGVGEGVRRWAGDGAGEGMWICGGEEG